MDRVLVRLIAATSFLALSLPPAQSEPGPGIPMPGEPAPGNLAGVLGPRQEKARGPKGGQRRGPEPKGGTR